EVGHVSDERRVRYPIRIGLRGLVNRLIGIAEPDSQNVVAERLSVAILKVTQTLDHGPGRETRKVFRSVEHLVEADLVGVCGARTDHRRYVDTGVRRDVGELAVKIERTEDRDSVVAT